MVSEMPETWFTRAGDVDIAYQVTGPAAGLDLVFVPGWVPHLEVMWELPEFARFLDRLAAMGRLIMFDKRGTGLSDRVAGMPTLEQQADDIVAVMDAAGSSRAALVAWGEGAAIAVGSSRAALVAWGEGAAIAVMFAATRPEPVAALVLGSMPAKVSESGGSVVPDPAMIQASSAAVEQGWGQASLVPVLAPSRAEDTRFLSWYRRWERMSSTPSAAAVKLIPDARCAELPGRDDLPYVGDADALLDVVQRFLTGVQGPPDLDRSLATVLFTNIIGSTQKADQLGDRRWRYLLDEHYVRIRRLLERFRGTEIDTAGDGFFAIFDGPARAIRCACAMRDAVYDIGLELRAGLHTGEVERRGAAATGLVVHLGARVAALAQANKVLVTSMVQMLVLGSGIGFADRGVHQLKGVPDRWQLFAVEHT